MNGFIRKLIRPISSFKNHAGANNNDKILNEGWVRVHDLLPLKMVDFTQKFEKDFMSSIEILGHLDDQITNRKVAFYCPNDGTSEVAMVYLPVSVILEQFKRSAQYANNSMIILKGLHSSIYMMTSESSAKHNQEKIHEAVLASLKRAQEQGAILYERELANKPGYKGFKPNDAPDHHASIGHLAA